jgi:hypothetical protein
VAKKISRVPGPRGEGEIFAEDLEYQTIKEDWNIYKLEDGTTLRIKMVVENIYRALMDDKKTIRYTPKGEPMYTARWTAVMTPDVPDGLIKRK